MSFSPIQNPHPWSSNHPYLCRVVFDLCLRNQWMSWPDWSPQWPDQLMENVACGNLNFITYNDYLQQSITDIMLISTVLSIFIGENCLKKITERLDKTWVAPHSVAAQTPIGGSGDRHKYRQFYPCNPPRTVYPCKASSSIQIHGATVTHLCCSTNPFVVAPLHSSALEIDSTQASSQMATLASSDQGFGQPAVREI